MMARASQSSALLLLAIAMAAVMLEQAAGMPIPPDNDDLTILPVEPATPMPEDNNTNCSAPVTESKNASRVCTNCSTCCDLLKIDKNASKEITYDITTGKYIFFGNGPFTPAHTYCDLETKDEAWTVIMRRWTNNTKLYTDFNRNWTDYVNGFGSLEGGFWYGLRQMQSLTKNGEWMLRIEVTTADGDQNITYNRFQLLEDDYKMVLSDGYTGNDDNLSEFDGIQFSTFDHGSKKQKDCAKEQSGGWWYRDNCVGSRGSVFTSSTDGGDWYLEDKFVDVYYYEMKISPKNC